MCHSYSNSIARASFSSTQMLMGALECRSVSYPFCQTALQADEAEAVAGLEARIAELAGQLAEQQGAGAALEAALGAPLLFLVLAKAKLLALINFNIFSLS